MNMDNVQLLSEIDESVIPDSRVSRNQIKTRNTSFQSIYRHWRDYRSYILNQKLNDVKGDLIRNMSTADYKEIQEKNNLISTLEDKIEILSKSDMPSKYIKHRAIKLREKMMNSFLNNSIKLYAGKVFEKPNVFTPETSTEVDVSSFVVPTVVESMAAANTSSPINVESVSNNQEKELASEIDRAMGDAYYDEPIDRNNIEQVVEEALNNTAPNQELASDEVISHDEIQQVIDDELNKDVENHETVVNDDVKVVTPEEVAQVVNDNRDSAYNAVDDSDLKVVDSVGETDSVEETHSVEETDSVGETHSVEETDSNDLNINYSNLKDAVDQALEDIKVTQNENSAVNVDLLPPHVEEENYEYKPMTDEEIARARENIEFDKYEKRYKDEWENVNTEEDNNNVFFGGFEPLHDVISNDAIRDDVVVVPEKNDVVSSNTKDDELHFDYSDATESDLTYASEQESSKLGLQELKDRALKLKEIKKQSEEDFHAAKSVRLEEAKKALEVRNVNLSKKLDYVEALKKLKEYCDSLEVQTKEINNSTESIRNDTEINRQFIQSQFDEIDDYDNKMKEIDSIISSDNVNSRSI